MVKGNSVQGDLQIVFNWEEIILSYWINI